MSSVSKKMFVLKYDNLYQLNELLEDGWYVCQMNSCANDFGATCFVYLERLNSEKHTNNKGKKNTGEQPPTTYNDLPF